MNQIKIPFKGWDLVAWINEKDGDHMIAVRPIAEAIGVDPKSQRRKIERDPRFTWGHMTSHDSIGREQKMLCLPVRQLNGWLYGINANKVKPEVREKLLNFQEECHIHLHNALSGRANADVVDALRKLVEQLVAANETLTKRVEELEANQSAYNYSEQIMASVGGKLMSGARKTKNLRGTLH